MNQCHAVRALPRCPNCHELKPADNLLCWPCHHSQKHHNDGNYSKRLWHKIEMLEKTLLDAAP